MSGGRPKHAASPDLPSTSTISTLMPVRVAAVASAAVTVVLPTPPLPATMTTREAEQKRSRSMAQNATGVPLARFVRRASRRASCSGAVVAIVLACASGALGATGAACGLAGRSARHRRRAGRGLLRSAQRVADARRDRAGERDRHAPLLDLPGEVAGRDRRRRAPRSSARSTGRRCRSSCGSGRRVPTPRARPRCCSQAAHLAYISPNSGAGPGQPVRLDDPGARSMREVGDRTRRAGAQAGRDPDGARRLATERLGSPGSVATSGATDGVRPTIGELIVQTRRQDGHHRGGRRQAVDRQGDRHRPRPSPPAEPGGALQPARPRRRSSCTGSSARRSRTSCSSSGSR